MAQLSYNSLNNGTRLGFGSVLKKLLVVVIIAGVFVAGYGANTIVKNMKYRPAENVAKSFIANITKDDYAAAANLGTDAFKDKFGKEDSLKSSLGDLTGEEPQYKEAVTFKNGNYVQYSQLVDGLTPNQHGVTDANFIIDVVKVDGKWQVAAVTVE